MSVKKQKTFISILVTDIATRRTALWVKAVNYVFFTCTVQFTIDHTHDVEPPALIDKFITQMQLVVDPRIRGDL